MGRGMVDQVVHRGLGVDHVGHGGETLLVPHGGDHADARHAGHLYSILLNSRPRQQTKLANRRKF